MSVYDTNSIFFLLAFISIHRVSQSQFVICNLFNTSKSMQFSHKNQHLQHSCEYQHV